jgi:sensor histidine kinase YesM
MYKDHQKKLEKLLTKDNVEWDVIYEDHQEMIVTIQHERLIHLLVTLFVGSVMAASFLVTIALKASYLLLLDIPLLLLFVGYLFHYRYLENTTQSWYHLRKKIKDKMAPITC